MYTSEVEHTKKDSSAPLVAIPRISANSPLARGFTVSIVEEASPAGDWWLRVWNQGEPVEDSRWSSASNAGMRVGAIILNGTVGANLRGQAMAAAAQFMGEGGQ